MGFSVDFATFQGKNNKQSVTSITFCPVFVSKWVQLFLEYLTYVNLYPNFYSSGWHLLYIILVFRQFVAFFLRLLTLWYPTTWQGFQAKGTGYSCPVGQRDRSLFIVPRQRDQNLPEGFEWDHGTSSKPCNGRGRDGILTFCHQTGRAEILTACPVLSRNIPG